MQDRSQDSGRQEPISKQHTQLDAVLFKLEGILDRYLTHHVYPDLPEVGRREIREQAHKTLHEQINKFSHYLHGKQMRLNFDESQFHAVNAVNDLMSILRAEIESANPGALGDNQKHMELHLWLMESGAEISKLFCELPHTANDLQGKMIRAALCEGSLTDLVLQETDLCQMMQVVTRATLIAANGDFTTYGFLREDFVEAVEGLAKPVGYSFHSFGGWGHHGVVAEPSEFDSMANRGDLTVTDYNYKKVEFQDLVQPEDYETSESIKNSKAYLFPVKYGPIYLGTLMVVALSNSGVIIRTDASKDVRLVAQACAEGAAHIARVMRTSSEFRGFPEY